MTNPTNPPQARHRRPTLTARLAAVPDTNLPDLDDDERPDRSRRWLLLLVALVVAGIGGVLVLTAGGNTAAEQRDIAVDQKLDLAGQVAQACANGQLAPTDRLCAKAAEAVAEPIPGRDGDAGRGVTSTSVVGGRLIVRYSDGTSQDAGTVAAAPGVAGVDGPPGRGIVAATIEAGRLVLTYSDGSRTDVGRIVGDDGRDGAQGRSVSSSAIVDGRLIVTYDDGTTQDAGPIPPGPQGMPGMPGAQGIGVSDVRAEERDGDCVLVFTLTDPATATSAEKVVPVSNGVCRGSLLGPP